MKHILRGIAVVAFLFGGLSCLALLVMGGVVFLWSFDAGSSTTFSTGAILPILGLIGITVASSMVGTYLWKRSNVTSSS